MFGVSHGGIGQKRGKFGRYSPSLNSMQFTQEQIEKELADVLPHGSREVIAKGTGIYPKIVDAYFNPFDERKSPHFTVLHIQAVLDNESPEIGDAVWEKLCALREAGKRRSAAVRDLTSTLIEKSKHDTSTNTKVLQAIKDGRIDRSEYLDISASIDTELRDLSNLRMVVAEAAEAVH